MIPAEEYGRALFMLASEDNAVTEVRDTLLQIDAVIAENPAYAALLDTPAIPTEEKLGLIDAAFGDAEQIVLNFLKILCEKRAVYRLHECVGAYRKLYHEAMGITEAVCITAKPISDAQRALLQNKLCELTGKQVLMTTETDPSLIGGIVLLMDGKQLDGSVRARLDTFRKRLADTVV